MGVFYSEQGEDRDPKTWETTVETIDPSRLLAIGCERPGIIDRPMMANRRFSWMDQVATSAQRRQSSTDPQTPGENQLFSPWGPQSPSALRATAAIWTPHPGGSSDTDEYAVESEGMDYLESRFAASSIGDSRGRRTSSTAGSSDSQSASNAFGFSNPPEGFKNAPLHVRKPSNLSDGNRGMLDDLRTRNLAFTQNPPKRAQSMCDPGLPQPISPLMENNILTPTMSVPSTGSGMKKGGLPELRTTSLSDFRLEDVRGPLATDDSLYAVVEFKLFRSEVYQLRQDWVGGAEGVCLVIVEADRGVDLGKVHHIGTDAEVARELKRNLNRRHWSALLQNSATSKPTDEESEIAFKQVYEWTASSPFAGGFTAGDGTMPPRSIVRRANRMEIGQLQFKEGLEERARRLCWQKAKDHGFTMEILAAEFQFDHQKLTFYFLAPGYVAFNPLINELYKIFKTRIWFVPLNPASFVNPQPSGHTPPSSNSAGSDPYHASSQAGQVASPKGGRRDSRPTPVQNIAFGATNAPRGNMAVGAGRRGQHGQPTAALHTHQSSPWNPGPSRTTPNNDWSSQFSPMGAKSPLGNQGPWS